MMANIVFASNNQGKIKEINLLLQNERLTVLPQAEFGVEEVAETGLTFIENALIKARHASAVTNLPAIADDSGLVVPALDGAPGIYSARYANTHGDHQLNINKLLAELNEKSDEQRAAYFYCVLVFLQHEKDPCPIVCEGIWHGEILRQPIGDKGFGYDPIFFDPTQQSTAAQLLPEIKNKISHRGQAMKKLLERLKNNYSLASFAFSKRCK